MTLLALVALGCSASSGNDGPIDLLDSGNGGSSDGAAGGMDGGPLFGNEGGMSGPVENTRQQCMDGVDNNDNGQVDCQEPGCSRYTFCQQPLPEDAGQPADGATSGCKGIQKEGTNEVSPVDIVWAVDTSLSMCNDAQQVQQNMDDFASFMAMKDIDFRVVMISDRNFVQPSPVFDNDPRFRFVQSSVDSQQPFNVLVNTWSQYSDFLRPRSTKNFAVVTDDNEDQPGNWLKNQLQPLLQNIGSSPQFKFHSIASPPSATCNISPDAGGGGGADAGGMDAGGGFFGGGGGGCFGIGGFIPGTGCCRPGGNGAAIAPGTQYWNLSQDTGGTTHTICTEDWSGVFDDLAKVVAKVEPLPCTFEIPEPPEGESFDRNKVNVRFNPENGQAKVFPQADSKSECGNKTAWYYDDNMDPKKIHLCPTACETVKDVTADINIQLGCETVPLK